MSGRAPRTRLLPLGRSRAGARLAVAVVAAIAGLALSTAGAASAQQNFEIQVYPSETVPAGTTMFELHSNVAAQGTTRKEDGVLPTQGAFHETLEITHGWTPWFETGFYLFTSIQTLQPDEGWQWVGSHIRPRIRAPESWELPVGLSLSIEAGYQRREFSTDTWSIEFRPIVDKQWGRWYVSVNPAFGLALKGQDVSQGLEFSPSAKVGYDITPIVSVGIEYYASLGPVKSFDRLRDQQHQIFPVIDLNLGPKWEFNAGVGIGLTPGTDRFIVKMILGYRFDWGVAKTH